MTLYFFFKKWGPKLAIIEVHAKTAVSCKYVIPLHWKDEQSKSTCISRKIIDIASKTKISKTE
jgi:hypothetical protein